MLSQCYESGNLETGRQLDQLQNPGLSKQQLQKARQIERERRRKKKAKKKAKKQAANQDALEAEDGDS